MGYGELFSYMNPKTVWHEVKRGVGRVSEPEKPLQFSGTKPEVVKMVHLIGSPFIRLAGISGALAVAMGAYGSHGLFPRKDVPDELKDIYKTANYYHFLHTLALLAVPLTRRPYIVGSIMFTGMTIFCGTCYYTALTGNTCVAKFTPYGGSLLILAWLTMIF